MKSPWTQQAGRDKSLPSEPLMICFLCPPPMNSWEKKRQCTIPLQQWGGCLRVAEPTGRNFSDRICVPAVEYCGMAKEKSWGKALWGGGEGTRSRRGGRNRTAGQTHIPQDSSSCSSSRGWNPPPPPLLHHHHHRSWHGSSVNTRSLGAAASGVTDQCNTDWHEPRGSVCALREAARGGGLVVGGWRWFGHNAWTARVSTVKCNLKESIICLEAVMAFIKARRPLLTETDGKGA